MRHMFFLTTLLLAVFCCFLLILPFSSRANSDKQLTSCADSFAQSFFRWQFQKSSTYCDESSQRWLRYMASQVTQDDIDSLKATESDVECTLGGFSFDNDSMASIEVHVSNYFRMDSLDKITLVKGESEYNFQMVRTNGFWRIRLQGFPQAVE